MAKDNKNRSDGFPVFDVLLWATLKALKALGGSGTIEEILDKVCEIDSIPEDVQKIPHKGGQRTRLSYRLAWARTHLKRYGAIENTERGVWAITRKGLGLTASDCEKIPAEVRRQRRIERAAVSAEIDAVDEDESGDFRGQNWRDELLGIIQKIDPSAFERLAQRLLRESGFTKVEVTGKTGDGGVDGMGILRVNLVSFTVLFQCKRYKGSVGSSTIRDFRGAMQGRCDKGLVITTGTFSPDARKEATRDGAPAIDLIDGEALCDLLKSLKLGVKVRLVEEIEPDEQWFKQI